MLGSSRTEAVIQRANDLESLSNVQELPFLTPKLQEMASVSPTHQFRTKVLEKVLPICPASNFYPRPLGPLPNSNCSLWSPRQLPYPSCSATRGKSPLHIRILQWPTLLIAVCCRRGQKVWRRTGIAGRILQAPRNLHKDVGRLGQCQRRVPIKLDALPILVPHSDLNCICRTVGTYSIGQKEVGVSFLLSWLAMDSR